MTLFIKFLVFIQLKALPQRVPKSLHYTRIIKPLRRLEALLWRSWLGGEQLKLLNAKTEDKFKPLPLV